MKNKTDRTIETYNMTALSYERNGIGLSTEEELGKFKALLRSNARILDAGCGFGRELLYFTKHGFDTYGIDASEELLKLARKRAPKANIQLVDLRSKLPFGNNFFDGIWARNSLHHLESKDLKNALSEIRRILKPNGIFLSEWKEGQGEIIAKEEFVENKERFFNLKMSKEIFKLTEEAGFEVIEDYIYNWSERYGGKRDYSNFAVIIAKKN